MRCAVGGICMVRVNLIAAMCLCVAVVVLATRSALADDAESTVEGSINAVDRDRRTPIYKSIRGSRTDEVKRLIALGADLSHRDMSGDTPLHVAVASGYAPIVVVLLEAGADPNAKNVTGMSPLFDIRPSDDESIFNALLEAGAKINLPTRHGETALHSYAQRGYKRQVELLIKHGADVKARSKTGRTVLSAAARSRRPEIVRAVLDAGAPLKADEPDEVDESPLIALFEAWKSRAHSHTDRIPDKVGECVTLLVKAGVAVDVKDEEGVSAIHWAAKHGDEAMLKLLVDAGADVDSRVDLHGLQLTPLMAAAAMRPSNVAPLLKLGAEMKAVDSEKKRKTAIFYAARHSGVEAIQAFIDAGDDINQTDGEGSSVLYAAAQGRKSEVIAALIKADVKIDEPALIEIVTRCRPPALKALVESGYDFKSRTDKGAGVLCRAAAGVGAQYDNVENLTILLDAGLDPNGVDPASKSTPLLAAVRNTSARHQSDLVTILVEAGAKADAIDENGRSLLHHAVLVRNERAVQALIAAGCDVNHKDKSGVSPLALASKSGHARIIELLRAAGAQPDE